MKQLIALSLVLTAWMPSIPAQEGETKVEGKVAEGIEISKEEDKGIRLESKANGYSLRMPTGWELFPPEILRMLERAAKNILKGDIKYDFAFQAPGKDEWQIPPYVYVTILPGLSSNLSNKEIRKILEDSYGKESIESVGGLLKKGLEVSTGDEDDIWIDEMMASTQIVFDEANKSLHTRAEYASPEYGKMVSHTVIHFGRYANVQVNFYSRADQIDIYKDERNSIFSSFRYFPNFKYVAGK